MYCLTCGSAIERGHTFCVHCGSPTGQSASPSGSTNAGSPGLQPLGVGERIDAAFKAYFANFSSNVRAVLVVALPFGLLEAIIATSSAPSGPLVSTTTNVFGQQQVHVHDLWTYLAGILAVTVISAVVSLWVSATSTLIVGSRYVGEPISWRDALRHAFGRLGSMLWIFLLLFLAYVVPFVVVGGVAVVLFAVHATVVGIVVAVVGGLGYLAFVVWFYTAQSLAVPTLMLENIRGVQAIRRSIQLSRTTWLSMFGTLFLAALIVGFATAVLSALIAAVTAFAHNDTTLSLVLQTIERAVVLVLLTPFTATVLVVLAIDMRVRKEGYDLELLANQLRSPSPSTPGLGSSTTGSGFPELGRPGGSWSLPESPPPPEG